MINQKFPKAIYSQLKSLRALARNNDLYISRFDNGNGICIDDKVNYITKMNEFLADDYKLLLTVLMLTHRKTPSLSQKTTWIANSFSCTKKELFLSSFIPR